MGITIVTKMMSSPGGGQVSVVRRLELAEVLGRPVLPYPLILNSPLNFRELRNLCNRMGPGVSYILVRCTYTTSLCV